ncbi:unnamed protein product [Caenorhabditis brenneri]
MNAHHHYEDYADRLAFRCSMNDSNATTMEYDAWSCSVWTPRLFAVQWSRTFFSTGLKRWQVLFPLLNNCNHFQCLFSTIDSIFM